jgi:hypothetical protein|tara:strand:+ start:887 stop:1123 length:237 start_codon:yes stop_codon:yes gene_type:complete
MMRYKWKITTGDAGASNNQTVTYSLHPNGRRALHKAIQDFANETGKECWAEVPDAYSSSTYNRYYPKLPIWERREATK